MSLLEKIAAGSGILIGVYLIVTNPTGSSSVTNSLSSAANSFVKSLQGR